MDICFDKLSETQHFLERMRSNLGNQYEFNYDLSAFLSSARSILQYIYEVDRPETKVWYERKISDSAILKQFRDLRDGNIHDEPVRTKKHATSAGERTHYFNSKYTRDEVLRLAEDYVSEIQNLLQEGIRLGYLQGS